MIDALYIRRVGVQVGPVIAAYVDDDSVRIRFRISKNPWAKEPNSAHIEIYNLSPQRRGIIDTLIPRHGELGTVPVTVEAGYAHSTTPGIGLCFKGALLAASHARVGADIITKIIAASYEVTEVPLTAVIPAGRRVIDAVKDVLTPAILQAKRRQTSFPLAIFDVVGRVPPSAARLLSTNPLQQINVTTFGENRLSVTLKRARGVSGKALDIATQLVDEHGFTVSEQDNGIQIRHESEAITTRSIILDSSSGLIGPVDPVNDVRRPGVFLIRAESLLRHDLDVGTAVQLASIANKGLFVVEQVVHRGDTHGGAGAFVTQFHGRALVPPMPALPTESTNTGGFTGRRSPLQ